MTEYKEQEAAYEQAFRDGKCTFGDMSYKRHRDVRYSDEYPAGYRYPHCGILWVDWKDIYQLVNSSDMKICCSQEHYDKVVQYAESINDRALENCLEYLKQWEKNENRPCKTGLHYDHVPYSFGFCERYSDGNTGIVGGLLYHGDPGESFTITIERSHGWSVHT